MCSQHSTTQFTSRAASACKLPYEISKILGEHTCENRSKNKGIGFAEFSHYGDYIVNSFQQT
jgi:hypothetical protein